MRFSAIFLIGCLLAALVPLLPSGSVSGDAKFHFSGWPTRYEGCRLSPVGLSEREQRFADGFPGRIAKFADHNRVVIVRWLTQPTRKLHPAADCFKGSGYSARPLPTITDSAGRTWGCFEATSNGQSFHVSERIHDEAGHDWTDVSAWYWAALLGRTQAPWWAVTVVDSGMPALLGHGEP